MGERQGMNVVDSSDYYRSLIILISFLLLFEGIVFYFGSGRPYWGDEAHYVETIDQFGNDLSLNTITHYNEMSTPLPFILYSIWGLIFSFDIRVLRVFSIVIAFATYLFFHKLAFELFNHIELSLLSTVFIAVHPYMVGLSVFVFTDMLAILFIVISCISIRERNPISLSISLACGLLCRQYLIFHVAAAGLYYFVEYCGTRRMDSIKMLSSCLISLAPLIILGVIWKGIAPDNEVKKIYMDEGWRFHPSYLTLYVCQFFIYLLPVISISWRIFYKNGKTMFLSFVISGFYWLFPVRASKYQLDGNIHTVGFVHKSVKTVLGNQFVEDIVFYMAFLLGLPIIIFIIKDICLNWRDKKFGFEFFLDLSVISFLIVMPFSYLCWEKYFLPLLPLVTLRILLAKYSDNMKNHQIIKQHPTARSTGNE